MKNIFIIFAFSIGFKIGVCQNLVPNSGFEVYDTCPPSGEIHLAPPWFRPTDGTSDYFNSCTTTPIFDVPTNDFGDQLPHSGNSYAGMYVSYYCYDSIVANYREYIEVKLLSPLIPGVKYFVSFFVSLSDNSAFATDHIGVYFSVDSITESTYYTLSFIPQIINTPGNYLTDKSNWTQVTSSFVAAGNEKFITIGNFNDWANTDTIHVPGGEDYTINPAWGGGYYYIDDIYVSVDSLTSSKVGFDTNTYPDNLSVYPNPTSQVTYLEYDNPQYEVHTLKIFNQQGQLVRTISGVYSDRIEIVKNELPSGFYFFLLLTDRGIKGTGKLIFE